jgi:hypothetical protein
MLYINANDSACQAFFNPVSAEMNAIFTLCSFSQIPVEAGPRALSAVFKEIPKGAKKR